MEAAFRAVSRHLFLPDVGISDVYTDRAFPTKHAGGKPISSSSQPAIMAIMLEQLALEPRQRVLEIGAGTGYNAALIARIVGQGGHVVTIDIDEDLVMLARKHLAAAGFDRVDVRVRMEALDIRRARLSIASFSRQAPGTSLRPGSSSCRCMAGSCSP